MYNIVPTFFFLYNIWIWVQYLIQISDSKLVYLLEIVGEAVNLGREDLDDGEPEGDPLVAVLRAVEVRDQSVVQASFQPATKYTRHCLRGTDVE